jgi:prepilin-type N-terminal cleavage/methylation domain-containing protein
MLEPPAKRVVSYLSADRGRVTIIEGILRGREHVRLHRRQRGFSLVELLIVVVIVLVMGAFAIPSFMTMLRTFRIGGDAVSINGEILMAKMRAAARFTRTRVFFDTANNQFRTEWWNKTTNQWVQESVGAPANLSRGVTFSFGAVGTGPDTNPTALSPACMSGTAGPPADPGGGTPDPNSACILFNSRGFPITAAGGPTASHAIYITDGVAVFGVTLSATGLNRVWRIGAGDTSGYSWVLR